MPNISIILHDIRSTHNVGSILRTCDGFGVQTVYIGGYTPYPLQPNDSRLPHISSKLTKDIAKTALGAEESVYIVVYENILDLIDTLRQSGADILALEQSAGSVFLPDYKAPGKDLALILGREVEGIDPGVLSLCDQTLEIPMRGQKESFNVSVAAGMALYALTNNNA
jgi:23S rRNA (guanosine2251-2'-O)-methyltransferase